MELLIRERIMEKSQSISRELTKRDRLSKIRSNRLWKIRRIVLQGA